MTWSPTPPCHVIGQIRLIRPPCSERRHRRVRRHQIAPPNRHCETPSDSRGRLTSSSWPSWYFPVLVAPGPLALPTTIIAGLVPLCLGPKVLIMGCGAQRNPRKRVDLQPP